MTETWIGHEQKSRRVLWHRTGSPQKTLCGLSVAVEPRLQRDSMPEDLGGVCWKCRKKSMGVELRLRLAQKGGLQQALNIIDNWVYHSNTTADQKLALQAVAGDIQMQINRLDKQESGISNG